MKRPYNKKAAQKTEKDTNKSTKATGVVSKKNQDAFTNELISQLNKDAGSQIAWNLESGDAPTNIKRWISTGSRQLDCILSNKVRGGLPEGRIVEISGPSSSGKSHICLEVAKATQKLGGIVVYIDTENATNLENLRHVGVNVHERFVFVQTACTEEIFAVAESAIMKARSLTKDVPVTIIWDSIAASSPKAELEGNYDQNTIGLQARVMGKGLRKITNIIGNQNVLFLMVNQQRKAIGVMFGDDCLNPKMTITIRKRLKQQEVTFEELANMIGIDDLETPELYEIEDQGYEVLSVDPVTGVDVWKPIQNFVVKPKQDMHYDLHGLRGTAEHRVLLNGTWTKLSEHPEAIKVEEETQVVDLTVKDTHTYKCVGQINHNTTTPGGMAIPYSCSVRIRITSTGQSHIKDKDDNIIGIKVKAKTIKNKVAKPFRDCEFQIIFGKGVYETEEVFDLFRSYCETTSNGFKMPDGETVLLSGTGAWKNFLVTSKDGEVLQDIKFHKPDFGSKVLNVPEFSKYMEALYEASLVIKPGIIEHPTLSGPDEDSFEEIRGLAIDSQGGKKELEL